MLFACVRKPMAAANQPASYKILQDLCRCRTAARFDVRDGSSASFSRCPRRACSPRQQTLAERDRAAILVRAVGLEPTRRCHRGILSPLRLPVPPRPLWSRDQILSAFPSACGNGVGLQRAKSLAILLKRARGAKGKASIPTPAAALGILNIVGLRKSHDRFARLSRRLRCAAAAAMALLALGHRARRLRRHERQHEHGVCRSRQIRSLRLQAARDRAQGARRPAPRSCRA